MSNAAAAARATTQMTTYHTRFQPDKVHESAFVAAGAVIVGDVTLGPKVSIWFNAVLRGDSEALIIGEDSNIQDGAVCHADPGLPLITGRGVTLGHRAIVHGAQIGDCSLIGMGVIVLNGARIGSHCLVGAGALVTQHKEFPDRSFIIGAPARRIRSVTDDEIAMIKRTADNYIEKTRAFRATGDD